MSKYVIIDNRMRKIEKEKLRELGYNLFEIDTNTNLYYEISSHTDIFCCKVKNVLVFEKTVYDKFIKYIKNIEKLDNVMLGNKQVQEKYPNDILYNVCIIGNFAIHNFKYTDKTICDLIEKYNLKKINIKQGYSKCSIAAIDEKSVIVSDKAIAKILNENGIETLLIENVNNIKLLTNNNSYSNMQGFIGGVMSKLGDMIFVSGDLRKIDTNDKIRKYIESKNLKIIDFPSLDIIDYGGIIECEM